MKKSVQCHAPMQVGDLIRLKQIFMPSASAKRGYRYATIFELIRTDDADPTSPITEILAQLCEGDRSFPYTDTSGTQPIYSFYPDEIEPLDDGYFKQV
ncbi:MAG: hypothetical protein VKL39_15470 [Leptolyngbyaceae bacterium]|nr:hypothetical protein [Leptolyngbyaceae bacterium]